MSNFLTRTLAGAVFAAIVIGLVWYGPLGLLCLMVLIGCIGIFEFLRIRGQFQITAWMVLSAIHIFLILGSGRSDLFGNYAWLFSTLAASLALLLVLFEIRKHGLSAYSKLAEYAFAIVYISLPLSLFFAFSTSEDSYNIFKPLMVIFLVWSSDTFAYLTGRWLGKTPLYPSLSPKKTVEGFAGGTVLTAILGAYLSYTWNIAPPLWGLILGLLVSITGTAGDLFESSLKRNAGVKDSGRIIPGHGGVLDRFDAFLFVCVLAWIWDAWLQFAPN